MDEADLGSVGEGSKKQEELRELEYDLNEKQKLLDDREGSLKELRRRLEREAQVLDEYIFLNIFIVFVYVHLTTCRI
jgi:hypothetical protein